MIKDICSVVWVLITSLILTGCGDELQFKVSSKPRTAPFVTGTLYQMPNGTNDPTKIIETKNLEWLGNVKYQPDADRAVLSYVFKDGNQSLSTYTYAIDLKSLRENPSNTISNDKTPLFILPARIPQSTKDPMTKESEWIIERLTNFDTYKEN
ncbi:hypothetical protein VCSRO123_3507 [Vibrio cholerae]|nr:hypothetical protein VCSRO123_3507 [Vibrio cholerae]